MISITGAEVANSLTMYAIVHMIYWSAKLVANRIIPFFYSEQFERLKAILIDEIEAVRRIETGL